MATRRRSIINHACIPDSSGNVFQEPMTVPGSNDVWGHLIHTFKDTATRIGLHGQFKVPKDYVGTPKLVITWTSVATSGNKVHDFDYRAVAAGESLDQAGNQESVTGTSAAPASALLAKETIIDLSANFAVDDTVQWTYFRDGTAADTIAASTHVLDLEFQYVDA